jgi:hypothetical protein
VIIDDITGDFTWDEDFIDSNTSGKSKKDMTGIYAGVIIALILIACIGCAFGTYMWKRAKKMEKESEHEGDGEKDLYPVD